jgi:hypothetical protein
MLAAYRLPRRVKSPSGGETRGEACAALRLIDRTDPLAEVVAKKIIEHAQRGERDPNRLREAVLRDLQTNRGPATYP